MGSKSLACLIETPTNPQREEGAHWLSQLRFGVREVGVLGTQYTSMFEFNKKRKAYYDYLDEVCVNHTIKYTRIKMLHVSPRDLSQHLLHLTTDLGVSVLLYRPIHDRVCKNANAR